MSGTDPASPWYSADAGSVPLTFGVRDARDALPAATISPSSSCIVPLSTALHSRGVTAALVFAL
jgi:hypothetical protein